MRVLSQRLEADVRGAARRPARDLWKAPPTVDSRLPVLREVSTAAVCSVAAGSWVQRLDDAEAVGCDAGTF